MICVGAIGNVVEVDGAVVLGLAAITTEAAAIASDVETDVLRPIAFVARMSTVYTLPARSDDKLNSNFPSARTVGITDIHVLPPLIEYL